MNSAPFGEPPCSSTMSGCLAQRLVERVPDRPWSLQSTPPAKATFGPAGIRGSISARRLAAREFAAVDQRRSEGAVIDLRAGARAARPTRVCASNSSAAWSRKNSMASRRSAIVVAFGDHSLELDGADFRAVLLLLAPALLVLVAVEFALDAIGGAVEEVDASTTAVVEVGLEPRVAQGRDEGVEDVGERALDAMLVGQGTWVGLVLMRAIAVDLQRVDDAVGGGRARDGFEVGVGRSSWRGLLRRLAAPSRPS